MLGILLYACREAKCRTGQQLGEARNLGETPSAHCLGKQLGAGDSTKTFLCFIAPEKISSDEGCILQIVSRVCLGNHSKDNLEARWEWVQLGTVGGPLVPHQT